MELIQALEQLSLEVRNHHGINEQVQVKASDMHQIWPITSVTDQPNNIRSSAQHFCSLYPSEPSDKRLHQIQDFDTSIASLLMQIADLDSHNIKSDRHPNLASIRNAAGDPYSTSSVYTSLEEDSDCSSQQSSGYSNSNAVDEVYMNPLVKDLLKRDLSAITDTVRKIGHILSIGSSIENIYTNLYTKHNNGLDDKAFNISYTRSLCETFISLCSNEPLLRDLPTIVRYNDYCYRLLSQISDDNILNNLNSTIYEFSLSDTNRKVDDGIEVCLDEEYTDSDVAFLNCDQRHVDNWTENKLYINNQDKI